MSSNDLNDVQSGGETPAVDADAPVRRAPARRTRRVAAAVPVDGDPVADPASDAAGVGAAPSARQRSRRAAVASRPVAPAPDDRERVDAPSQDDVGRAEANAPSHTPSNAPPHTPSPTPSHAPLHTPAVSPDALAGAAGSPVPDAASPASAMSGVGDGSVQGGDGSDIGEVGDASDGDPRSRHRPGRRRGRRGGRRGAGDTDGLDAGGRTVDDLPHEAPESHEPLPEGEPVPFHATGAWLGLEEAEPPVEARAADDDSTKLHKILADAGIGSRREMEALIEDGRVSVNGQPAHVGQRVAPTDQVRVNGRPLHRRNAAGAPRVVIYHKPAGEICTKDDPGRRPRVFEQLPRLKGARWISVGRLDLNSEGLLLFTTAGDVANRLMHPRYGWEREYAVRVLGRVDDETKARLLAGVALDDGPASLLSIDDVGGDGANHWYRVTIAEGRNREVRRIFDAVGLTVSRLVRIRFGPVALPPRLARGRSIELDEADVRSLVRIVRETASKVDGSRQAGGPAGGAGDGATDGATPPRGARGRNRRGRGLREDPGSRPDGWPSGDAGAEAAAASASGREPSRPDDEPEGTARPAVPRPAPRAQLPSYAGRAWTADRFEPDYDDEDIEHDDERDGQLAMIKDIDKFAAAHERARPVGAGVNLEDDDWQPKSETAHLEGITRAVKKDVRQLRYGGGLPAFGAGAGQPRDPNAPRRGKRPGGKSAKGGGFAKGGGKFGGKPGGAKPQSRPPGPRGQGAEGGGGPPGQGAPRPPGSGRKRRRNRTP
ncbi:MAG: 23S rRNA pseudouridine(2605) synthase RluB [Lautropia sp.]